jgi:hypothetical protein
VPADLKSPLKIGIFEKGQFYNGTPSQFPYMISKIPPKRIMQKNKVCHNAFMRAANGII